MFTLREVGSPHLQPAGAPPGPPAPLLRCLTPPSCWCVKMFQICLCPDLEPTTSLSPAFLVYGEGVRVGVGREQTQHLKTTGRAVEAPGAWGKVSFDFPQIPSSSLGVVRGKDTWDGRAGLSLATHRLCPQPACSAPRTAKSTPPASACVCPRCVGHVKPQLAGFPGGSCEPAFLHGTSPVWALRGKTHSAGYKNLRLWFLVPSRRDSPVPASRAAVEKL